MGRRKKLQPPAVSNGTTTLGTGGKTLRQINLANCAYILQLLPIPAAGFTPDRNLIH
jgi:hypothetical protein